MNVQQNQTSNEPKQQGSRFWIIRFAIVLGLPLLVYYGYCFGLWGGNNLFLQYLFQCQCPAFSNEWRYPEEIDVIVPACQNNDVALSRSGRLLYVREENLGFSRTYLLDLQTREKFYIRLSKSKFNFLTDDLLYVFVYYGHGYEGGDHIYDRRTDTMYAIQKPTHFQPSIYSDGDVVPILLLKALSQVDEIFLIDEVFEPVIALSSDFRDHPEHSFIFNALDFPGDNPGRVEQFLRENNVSFQLISASFPKEVLSGDGNLIARDDGIYLVRTNQKIVSGISSVRVRGWLSNEHGVIYSSHVGGPCLLQLGLPFTDGPICAIRVPQPVLLLKVPEEYLFSAPTP